MDPNPAMSPPKAEGPGAFPPSIVIIIMLFYCLMDRLITSALGLEFWIG
jgi:hypothetical protein